MKKYILAACAIIAIISLLSSCKKEILDVDLCNIPNTYRDMTADKHLTKITQTEITGEGGEQERQITNSYSYYWNGNRLDSCVITGTPGAGQSNQSVTGYAYVTGTTVWTFEYSGNHITHIRGDYYRHIFESDPDGNIGNFICHEHEQLCNDTLYYDGDFLSRITLGRRHYPGLDININNGDDYYVYPIYDSLCNIIDYNVAQYHNNGKLVRPKCISQKNYEVVWSGRNMTTHNDYYYEETTVYTYDSKINVYRCLPRDLNIYYLLCGGGNGFTPYFSPFTTLSENNPNHELITGNGSAAYGHYEYDGDYPISYTYYFPYYRSYHTYYEYDDGTGKRD